MSTQKLTHALAATLVVGALSLSLPAAAQQCENPPALR